MNARVASVGVLVAFAVLVLCSVGLVGGHHTDAHATSCPFTAKAVVACLAAPAEHLRHLTSATLADSALFLLLAACMLVGFRATGALWSDPRDPIRCRRTDPRTIVIAPLAAAFSDGILNPKLFA